jgi:hypothetical protein
MGMLEDDVHRHRVATVPMWAQSYFGELHLKACVFGDGRVRLGFEIAERRVRSGSRAV